MTAPPRVPPAVLPAVTVRAPAKVNLVLRVGRPRHDGFHPLNTVYQAISLYDDVRVEDAGRWQVSVTPLGDVDCSTVPLDQRNLAVRAGQALAAHHGLRRAVREDEVAHAAQQQRRRRLVGKDPAEVLCG